MLSKKDLKLLCEFADFNNPKRELDFVCFGNGGIYATDTRKVIKFHVPILKCSDFLTHIKVLNGFLSMLGKKDFATVVSGGDYAHLDFNGVTLNLDGCDFDYKYPDINAIISKDTESHFRIDSLNDIVFELSQRNCFVESSYVLPLIAHGEGTSYDVFYTPMRGENVGILKIVCNAVRDNKEGILYSASIMCKKFESRAS